MKTNIAIAAFSMFADAVDVIGIVGGVPGKTAFHPDFVPAAPLRGCARRE